MKIEFFIPKLPKSLNIRQRTHWAVLYREQSKWDLFVYGEWIRLNKYVFLNPVSVDYVLYVRNKRKRDLDNYIGGTKPITDALRRTFFTRDDYEWLKKISIRFEISEVEGTMIIIQDYVG